MQLGVPMEVFRRFMEVRRRQTFDCLMDNLKPQRSESCLELGGPVRSQAGIADYFARYVVLNMNPVTMTREARALPQYRDADLVVGDAVRLPFADGAFDYVLANALLEHIMPPKNRPQFAEEIRRVSRRGYFVSTPNYWFPLEPHYYMPFFQFLPEKFKFWLSQRVRMGWMYKDSYEPVSLATNRELRRLFPTAKLAGISFSKTIPETIIAWERYESPKARGIAPGTLQAPIS